MKHINLYQTAFHPPRVILPARRLLVWSGAFLGLLLALAAWDNWRLLALRKEVSQISQRAARLEASVKAGEVVRQADPRLLAEAAMLESRLYHLQLAQDALATGALGSETGYSSRFRALARAHVRGTWLTRIEIGELGREMNLYGRALTGEDSAHLIANLRREPLFVGSNFASLALAPPDQKDETAGSAPGKTVPPRYLEFQLSARSEKVAAPAAVPAGRPDPAALATLAAQVTLPATPAALPRSTP